MTTLDRPLRPRRILGPLVLIGIGVLFLLGNLGLPAWRFWETLLYLWPVLLIAAGLELLVGRRAPWAGWLIALIAVGVLLGGMLLNPRTVGGSLVSARFMKRRFTLKWPTIKTAFRRTFAGILMGLGALLIPGGNDTLLLIDPEWDLVFVFLTNCWGIDARGPDMVANAIYGALRSGIKE